MNKNKDKNRFFLSKRLDEFRSTQIEFKQFCEYCGAVYWAKSRKAKYCSDSCKQLKYLDKKNNKL